MFPVGGELISILVSVVEGAPMKNKAAVSGAVHLCSGQKAAVGGIKKLK